MASHENTRLRLVDGFSRTTIPVGFREPQISGIMGDEHQVAGSDESENRGSSVIRFLGSLVSCHAFAAAIFLAVS
jgi:hypothetical protein